MSARIEKRPSGAQSIERMARLMRALCANNDTGSRLVDLTRQSGLQQPTARRMLKSLIGERMVAQDEATRRYFLGQAIYEFGLTASRRFRLRDYCQASLDRIAAQTGDTVFLMVRSGTDAVCVDRREGEFPIKAFALNIGDKRPLGIGAGALALLSGLPDAEVQRMAHANARLLPQYGGPDVEALLALVRRTRTLGYALHDARAAPGIKMIGMALCDPREVPVAALSVSAIASRFGPKRRSEVISRLREEIAIIEARLL
jgi:DNA-binding IclR family transcriptional regulator